MDDLPTSGTPSGGFVPQGGNRKEERDGQKHHKKKKEEEKEEKMQHAIFIILPCLLDLMP